MIGLYKFFKYLYKVSYIVFSDKYLIVFTKSLGKVPSLDESKGIAIRIRHRVTRFNLKVFVYDIGYARSGKTFCGVTDTVRQLMRQYKDVSCFSYTGSRHKISKESVCKYFFQVIGMIFNDLVFGFYSYKINVIPLEKLKDWKYHE